MLFKELKKMKLEIEQLYTGSNICYITINSQITVLLSNFSVDCMAWKLLPTVDDGLKVKSSLILGRFTGDPDHMAEHKVIKRLGVGEGMEENTTTVSNQYYSINYSINCSLLGRNEGS